MTPTDWEMLLRVTMAFGLSGVLGFERGSMSQPAGLRTHMLVGAGSACFMLAGMYGFAGLSGSGAVDPSRVGAQIATGIGFLGAGTIWRSQNSVHGLTTAASIWMTAAIGMLTAGGLYALAIFSTVLATIALRALWAPSRHLAERSRSNNNSSGRELSAHRASRKQRPKPASGKRAA